MVERAAAFATGLAVGTAGGAAPPACRIGELAPACWFELLSLPGTSSNEVLRALGVIAPGLALPPPGRVVVAGGVTIGRLGPGRFVVFGTSLPADALSPLGAGFAIVDDSHAKAGVRISGAPVEVLRKGLSLDLDEAVFPAGAIAQARGFHLGLTVVRRAAACFDVFVARSFAGSFVSSLTDAADEGGWQGVGPVADTDPAA